MVTIVRTDDGTNGVTKSLLELLIAAKNYRLACDHLIYKNHADCLRLRVQKISSCVIYLETSF